MLEFQINQLSQNFQLSTRKTKKERRYWEKNWRKGEEYIASEKRKKKVGKKSGKEREENKYIAGCPTYDWETSAGPFYIYHFDIYKKTATIFHMYETISENFEITKMYTFPSNTPLLAVHIYLLCPAQLGKNITQLLLLPNCLHEKICNLITTEVWNRLLSCHLSDEMIINLNMLMLGTIMIHSILQYK